MPETNRREYTAQSKKMVPGSIVSHGPKKVSGGSKFPPDAQTRGSKATGSKWGCEKTLKSFTQLPPVGSWPKKGK